MRADVERWFARRTFGSAMTAEQLIALKGTTTISVVIPALDEADTVAEVVRSCHIEGLVDEIVVMDAGSTDNTALEATKAGARVVCESEVLPRLGRVRGKGEALWKSLFVTTGDVVVFVDADIRDPSPRFVLGLVAPLLLHPDIAFVKACYDRPLSVDGTLQATGGGRVTELVARPIIAAHWPSLSGIVQPLSGEYAGRRSLLESIPFIGGYGVELGLLVDVLDTVGIDAIAQVDLGRRVHRNQPDEALGRMAAAIWQAAMARLEGEGRMVARDEPGHVLTQFSRDVDGRLIPRSSDVVVTERPPMKTIEDYRARVRSR